MKEIAHRLGSESWPSIDLTLKQFALPWSDQWSGDSDAYIMAMVEKSPDQTLIELAQHLGFSLGISSHIDPAFWRKGMFRVFITHLAVYKKWVVTTRKRRLPRA
jgi:hypothetical protein